MKILVSSNCQTSGIADNIHLMANVPEVQALPIAWEESFDSIFQRVDHFLNDANIWIVSHRFLRTAEEVLAKKNLKKVRLINIPEIFFDAFHPDIAYAINTKDKKLLEPNYCSAILIWCFNNRLSPLQAERFFNHEVYLGLGYLDRWSLAARRIREDFEKTDLKEYFSEFFLFIKRSGCFMHSFNHPKLEVIAKLTELILRELNIEIKCSLSSGELNDGLNGFVWPIYPEIGLELGSFPTSYCWKYLSQDQIFYNKSEYIDYFYKHLEKQKIRPGEIEYAYLSASNFENVMNNFSKKEKLNV